MVSSPSLLTGRQWRHMRLIPDTSSLGGNSSPTAPAAITESSCSTSSQSDPRVPICHRRLEPQHRGGDQLQQGRTTSTPPNATSQSSNRNRMKMLYRVMVRAVRRQREQCQLCHSQPCAGTRFECCDIPVCRPCRRGHLSGSGTRQARTDCPFCGETTIFNDEPLAVFPWGLVP